MRSRREWVLFRMLQGMRHLWSCGESQTLRMLHLLDCAIDVTLGDYDSVIEREFRAGRRDSAHEIVAREDARRREFDAYRRDLVRGFSAISVEAQERAI